MSTMTMMSMDKLLTVLIQTSPIPSHPSIALLEALFRSFEKADGLLECRIYILADGAVTLPDVLEEDKNSKDEEDLMPTAPVEEKESLNRTRQKRKKRTRKQTTRNNNSSENNYKHGSRLSEDATERYRQHLVLLRKAIDERHPPFVPRHGGYIQLVELPHRHGSARAIQAALDPSQLDLVPTPLVMIGQHDQFFIRSVPLRACAEGLVRLLKDTNQNDDWLTSSPAMSTISSPLQHQERKGDEDSQLSQPSLRINCLHFHSISTLNYRDKIRRRYQFDIGEPIRVTTDARCRGKKEYIGDEEDQDKEEQLLPYPIVPLLFWYGRTHIASTSYYQNVIFGGDNKRRTSKDQLQISDHLEELLGPAQLQTILKHGSMDVHATHYGTYVLDQPPPIEEDGTIVGGSGEVLYHLSGRKVRAATTKALNQSTSELQVSLTTVPPLLSTTTDTKTTSLSYTRARSARAVVAGLELIPDDAAEQQRKEDNENQHEPRKQQQSSSRFRQRCFHCGIKGHSFKFCPQLITKGTSTSEARKNEDHPRMAFVLE